MAKRRGNFSRDAQRSTTADGGTPLTPAAKATLGAVEEKILDFSEDLGRLLGTAQRKASEWMGQRQTVLRQLQAIRSTADQLLHQLTVGAQSAAGTRGRKPGRPAGAAGVTLPSDSAQRGAPERKKKRIMSPEARESIAAAQRRRWAKVKRAKSARS